MASVATVTPLLAAMKPAGGLGLLLRRAAAVVAARPLRAGPKRGDMSSEGCSLQPIPSFFEAALGAPSSAAAAASRRWKSESSCDAAAAFAAAVSSDVGRGGGAAADARHQSALRPQIAAPSRPSLVRGPVAAATAAASSATQPSPLCGRLSAGLVVRRTFAYRVQNMIPWRRVRGRVVAFDMQSRKARAKNHAETLKRFRLTRFGWERRRARLHGKARRNRSWASKRKSRTIEYVHRSDLPKLVRTVPYQRLMVRDPIINRNVNLRPERDILPAHLG